MCKEITLEDVNKIYPNEPDNVKERIATNSDSIYDSCPHICCGDCKYFQVDADRREATTCKRIDHKHIKFAVPWFKSYDCGQLSGVFCSDFSPQKEIPKWLYAHWTSLDDYLDDKRQVFEADGEKYVHPSNAKDYSFFGLCLDDNTEVRYYVRYRDFYNNTFLNDDGSLKWIKKCHYAQSRKSPTGYKLVWEWNEDAELTEFDKEQKEWLTKK